MTDIRNTIASASRVVVKIGSSSLTQPDGGLDDARIGALVDQLAARIAQGHQVVLVSSGAIATGFPALGLTSRPKDLATQQASASVGQGLLIAAYTQAFAKHGLVVGQILLTAEDVTRRAHYKNAQQTFTRLLELGAVPIVNENDTVATDEIRLGDNDRLAALVAHVVQADALVLLSDVDGLYDGPPSQAGAQMISGVGSGGMATKVEAARIATGAGICVLLTSAANSGAALADASVGTVFHPTAERVSTRLLWLAHATTPAGQLVLDDGAANAVLHRGTSLLPAGVTEVRGDFSAGDPVDLLDQKGHVIARGLVNFDSDELPELLGRSTRDLARELGPQYEREIVHRDDLVILS